MAQVKLSDRLVMVHPVINIWTGKVSVRKDEMKFISADETPPDKLVQMGTKAIFPTEDLRRFNNLKQRTRRYLSSVGMPFVGGWLCPADLEDQIYDQLGAIKTAFHSEVDNLLQNYHLRLNEFLADQKNEVWRDKMASAIMTPAEVKRSLEFRFQLFSVQATGEGRSGKDFETQMVSLGEQLITDTVKEASDFYTANIVKCGKMHTKSKEVLVKIKEKLAGLAFMNPNAEHLIGLIDGALPFYGAEHTSKQLVSEDAFWQIMAPIMILSDRSKLERHLSGELKVEDVHQQIAPTVFADQPGEITEASWTSIGESAISDGHVTENPFQPVEPLQVESDSNPWATATDSFEPEIAPLAAAPSKESVSPWAVV
jgi:hypothetical protein